LSRGPAQWFHWNETRRGPRRGELAGIEDVVGRDDEVLVALGQRVVADAQRVQGPAVLDADER
jgi:hypothetical protein